MFIYFFTFFIIFILILTNAVTDAPNAIATLVGTKVINFKKAAFISAIFNFIGVLFMSFINFSVADCISGIVKINGSYNDIKILICSMISVILFALIAMKFGIPTSETHALVAGLTGSGIAVYGIRNINFYEWKNVIIGLLWSVIGTFIISFFINKILKKFFKKVKDKDVKDVQIIGCILMSFMHGAQDGQKFIGILIIFLSIVKGLVIPKIINPIENIWSIVFVSIVMFIGVSIGGKKIVENVGSDMVKIDNKQAFLTDISTAVSLCVASITRITGKYNTCKNYFNS